MKKFFFLLFTSVSVAASAQNQQTVIKTEALKMAKALAALDLETYASFSWPALANDPNSKQMIKQGVDSTEKYRKQFGIKVKSIIIGNPSTVITYKGVMQCTIPQNLTVEAMMGSITTESILIGLSTDGMKWYFVDANLFKSPQTKDKLPELSPKLIIPTVKPPVLKDANGNEMKQTIRQ
jgi:hypothetical protein